MKKLEKLFVLFLGATLLTSCGTTHKHNYNFENGQWFWSETETGYSASFTVNCDGCNENTEGHRLELEATVTKTVNNPTCTLDGATIYTATVEYGGKSYSDTKEVVIDKLNHNYTTMIVEGEYPKTYQAFDSFDDSGLTVKVVCENCEDEIVLTNNDYFIVYSGFGADSLSVGDTYVTISYHGLKKVLDGLTVTPITINVPAQDTSSFVYDGQEKVYAVQESEYYTVSGNRATNAGDYDVVISLKDKTNYIWNNGSNEDLVYHFTVNKAANEMTGFAEHYETTCCLEPDFSGVSSTANDIVYSYYKNAAMTNEVQLNQLIAGSYYIKAVSGGANYEQVVKTATLTVSHSYDQEVVSDFYLHTAPTEDENAIYYKSCRCGESSDTETFVAQGTKLPSFIANSSFVPAELINEEAPEGFTKVSKGTVSYEGDLQGHEFLNDIDINNYSRVDYAFKTENRRLCDVMWEGDPIPLNEWHFVTITKNQDGTFTSVIKDSEGNVKITNESATSFRNTILYYNYDGEEPFMIWYSTEVIGVKLDPIGEFVSASSVASYETLHEAVPFGYLTVTKGTVTYNDSNQGNTFLANLDVHKYSSVFFAFKTANRRFCHYPSWGNQLEMNEWYYATITKNADGTYTSVIKDRNGVTKFGYENKSSFSASIVYCNWDGSEPNAVWYSTEVRGIKDPDSEVVPTGVIIDNSALSANGVTIQDSNMEAPDGFVNVKECIRSDFVHGMFYSAQDLRGYSEVHFAFLTTGYFIFNGWDKVDASASWLYFTLTQNADGTWNMVCKKASGAVVDTRENMNAYVGSNPDVYTNYSLNAILKGCQTTGFYSSQKDGTEFKNYCSELRGTAK